MEHHSPQVDVYTIELTNEIVERLNTEPFPKLMYSLLPLSIFASETTFNNEVTIQVTPSAMIVTIRKF